MTEPIITFPDVPACVAWFERHHDDTAGFLCRIGKGEYAAQTVSYPEVLTVALCFGWIDGQKRSLDEGFWLQRMTPRGPRSKWSKINREKAEALIASGEMRPSGQRAIDAARADGRWDAAYAGSAAAEVPDDLAAALAADPVAAACFATLSGANRYAILYRIQDAKKPETRAARIAKYVRMCHDGEVIHPGR
jgi:uncharacterized protein YdeI (YjbR/CyaY-like superfamily)